jgi:hypothetical protein
MTGTGPVAGGMSDVGSYREVGFSSGGIGFGLGGVISIAGNVAPGDTVSYQMGAYLYLIAGGDIQIGDGGTASLSGEISTPGQFEIDLPVSFFRGAEDSNGGGLSYDLQEGVFSTVVITRPAPDDPTTSITVSSTLALPDVPVPEPSTLSLLSAGVCCVIASRRFRRGNRTR